MKGEGGFALVITLIITALLIALTAEFVNEVYVDTTARQNFIDGQQASILADSGITGGIKIIQLSLAAHRYTSLLDSWAKPLQIDDEQGSLKVTIEDESGKLNLNSLVLPNGTWFEPYHGMAVRLFKTLNLSLDLLDALADWIDVNDEPRPAGAETPYYQGLKPPYSARNGLLNTMEELRLVKGFSAATVERLRPFVTVYADSAGSQATRININTAPREVIAALDEQMSDSLAGNVLDFRKSTPFKTSFDLAKVAGMETISQGLATSTTALGAVFRITSLAQVKDTSRIIEAVVRVTTSQSAVLYWREY